ncbi:MAG: 2-octaprenyl-6-methoxyphenyl hydroxylase [Gammaproteobacteria bacterium]|nr:2-octaprenyl-6-methoxyphenyl hydroxylase [Gammaproteobacteria bacterium]
MKRKLELAEVKDQYSIVIVGGGLVGSTLAIALNQAGIEPLVVEAFEQDSDQQPSFDDRSVALSLSSLEILNQLGIYQCIDNTAEPIKHIHVSDQGHYGFCRLESEKLGVTQLGAVIENHRFGHALLDQVAASSIDYLVPATVTKIDLKEPSNQILIESKGQQKKVKCQLIILAEGARSELKNDLGFETQITDYQSQAIVCNVKPQLPHQNWAYERFTEHGPLALLPLSQDRLSIVWSQSLENSEQLLKLSDTEFAKALEQTFGARLGKIEKVGKRMQFPLSQSVTGNSIKQGCLLLGNSAQALHPIAGQGLNLALRDIAALKAYIEQTLLLEARTDLGSYAWLRDYQLSRKQDRQQTIASTETLARLFVNPWKPLSISRNLLMKALDVTPIIKQEFAQSAMGYRA